MLRKFLNSYISKVKRENYELDKGVPTGYLLREVWARLIMKVRGKLFFPGSSNTPFAGRAAVVRCRKQVSFGKGLQIGERAYIDALSTDGIVFGNNVSVGNRTRIECTGNLRWLGKGLTVGDDVGLGTDNFYGCAGGISVGNYTIVGNFVSFHAENHNYSDPQVPIRYQGVSHEGIRIGSNCWIGAKCTILDGAVIEDGCVIAAGALVIAGVYKENGIYGGVPARFIKNRMDES